jgi:hypothetical protein
MALNVTPYALDVTWAYDFDGVSSWLTSEGHGLMERETLGAC